MGAGTYREVLSFQSQTSTRDSYGNPVNTWTTFITTRGSFEPTIGREFFSTEQVNSQIDVAFRIRYKSAAGLIKPKHRVLYRGNSYEILYEPIDVLGDHLELLIYCKKVV
jgi:SPP1 family predicted phage head-tail adaptor